MKSYENSGNAEEVIIPPKKGMWNIKQIEKSFIIKMKQFKIYKLLNDSTVSASVAKNGSK